MWARKHLFLSNNLFSLHIYLQEKKRDLQAYTSSVGVGAGGKGAGPGSAGMESLRMLLQLADTVEKRYSSCLSQTIYPLSITLTHFYEIVELVCLIFELFSPYYSVKIALL